MGRTGSAESLRQTGSSGIGRTDSVSVSTAGAAAAAVGRTGSAETFRQMNSSGIGRTGSSSSTLAPSDAFAVCQTASCPPRGQPHANRSVVLERRKFAQLEKLFYDGIELRTPATFVKNCIWVRATTNFRSIVVQCGSAKSRTSWLTALQQASDMLSGEMLEKQFTEAERLYRISLIDKATEARVAKLETTIYNLDAAVSVAQREARLGSRGVSRFEQDPHTTAGLVASASYFSKGMFELKTKTQLENAALNIAPVFQHKEKQEPLRLFLNTAKADTLWRFLDMMLSVLPVLSSISSLIVMLVFKLPAEQVLGGVVLGVLITLYRPWVKLKVAEQTLQRTHILGKSLKFTAKVFDKKHPENAFWKLWFYNWCWAVVSFGVSRFISDADFKEAEWLDEHVFWEDHTISSLGLVLAVDYRPDAEPPGQVKCVIAGGAAAEAGTVAKDDVIIRVDGHTFSNGLSVVNFFSKYTSTLTFQNLCKAHRGGAIDQDTHVRHGLAHIFKKYSA